MPMPRVNIDDPEQNAFVQDWLTSYHTHVTLVDVDEQEDFDIVYEKMIEAIQETYNPTKRV